MPTRRRAAIALACVLACAIAACGDDDSVAPACPQAGAAASEACVRAELGIPAEAQRVMLLSQSSHLDWDWLKTFDAYYTGQVDGVLTDAVGLLSQFHGAPAHYYYSIAEMGYLQRFVSAHPELLAPLRAAGNDLRIVGGGITSPDNLLPSGEAFIRDYLVGKTWVDATLGLPVRAAWLPDDFGHDAQLPVALEAMGLGAVGFARVPGVDTSLRFGGKQPAEPGSLAAELLATSLDFVWQAADGSEVLAHWMPQGYCQGDRIDQPLSATGPNDELADAIAHLHAFLAVNGPASVTPYIFVPIGCDFARPKERLLDYVQAWNESEYATTGVWAVGATFDHYTQLIAPYRDRLPQRRFDPTPYWTGFYASRPALKALHLAATQALLGAELYGAIADGLQRLNDGEWVQHVAARTETLHEAWALLVPSNHHDFVTGTAPDLVYQGEQLPRLNDALSTATSLRDAALDELGAALAAAPGPGEHPVAVFNQLGFDRRGLVEIADPAPDEMEHARTRLGADGVVQRSLEGGVLFQAVAPSFGYETAYLSQGSADPGADAETASLTSTADGASLVLENAALRAEVRRDAAWGLTSVVDKATGAELLGPGAVGNALVIYADQGGLYRFGNEMEGCTLTPHTDGVDAVESLPAQILEAGPLRVQVSALVMIGGRSYFKVYTLVAGEPFLRMSTTGAAPPLSSVMVEFPLAGTVDELVHGTPYHWDSKAPERASYSPAFEATHDFLVARFQGTPRAAIFHAGTPAWTAQRDGLLLGVLLRNTRVEQCDFLGALGTDAEVHTATYALRVPTGIEPSETGAQLREALSFSTPLVARAASTAGPLPPRFSLASIVSGPAMLTAAKSATTSPYELILRVYQPSNAPVPVELTTAAAARFPAGSRLRVGARTALETALDPAGASRLRLRGSPSDITFIAERAVTTLSITDQR